VTYVLQCLRISPDRNPHTVPKKIIDDSKGMRRWCITAINIEFSDFIQDKARIAQSV
jgi:hypothetical protein